MNILNHRYRQAVRRWSAATWQQRTVASLALLAAVSLLAAGVYAAATRTAPETGDDQADNGTDTVDEAVPDDIPDHYIRRKLDGVYVEPAVADLRPLAVMIDNDPNARPHAGLARAQLVYEAKAEAGITRFMALFAADEKLPAIGPVRSARPYFVRWAEGYDALYVHVGGSPEALELLSRVGMPSINEFYNGSYFWRADDKIAPHNVHTSTENLRGYLEKRSLEDDDYRGWRYKDDAAATERPSAQTITVNYSVTDFLVEWNYDAEKNAYRRRLGGAPHNDADGTPIYAKNILIAIVPARVVDEQFRRQMDMVGSGQAWYCLDGTCREGEWKKPLEQEREVFYDANGEDVALNGGTTWVEVVQSKGEVEIENAK